MRILSTRYGRFSTTSGHCGEEPRVKVSEWEDRGVPDALLCPAKLYTAAEVMSKQSPAPREPGLYAWYFDQIPGGVDAEHCHQQLGMTLLYVGISPSAPPMNGRGASRSHINRRLRSHYGGNASGSTLRLTLGCLLAQRLGIELRRVGRSERYTFTNPGEQQLDRWMDDHAFVAWFPCERPWEVEERVFRSGLPLPLNLAGNTLAVHVGYLSPLRRAARARADELPVILDNGGPRRSRRHQT